MDKIEKEIKKQRHQLLVLMYVFLALLIGLAIWVSTQVAELRHIVTSQNAYTQSVVEERFAQLQALNSPKPTLIPGPKGEDGRDAVSTHTVVEHEVPIKGDKGDPAPRLQIQYNPVTMAIETKYEDSDLWTVLVKACVLTNNCDKEVGSGL